MKRALLVGSNETWRDQIDPILFAHDIAVEWWWPTVTKLGAIPSGCDVVIVTTDNCSHKLSKPAMERARRAGVPLVCGPHRRAAMSVVLARQGFPLAATPPLWGVPTLGTASALATLSDASMTALMAAATDPLPPPPPEIIEALSMLLSAPVPVPAPIPAPVLVHAASVDLLTAVARDDYSAALPLVAANPWITTAEVAAILTIPVGALYSPLRCARDTLGIRAGQGSGPSRITDRARYEAGCAALGVSPVAEAVGPTRPPNKAIVPAAVATVVPVVVTPEPEPEALAAPVPAPKPQAPALAAPAPADTREALLLLLESMRAEGVEHIAIGADGTVNIRRRVVVTSTFSL